MNVVCCGVVSPPPGGHSAGKHAPGSVNTEPRLPANDHKWKQIQCCSGGRKSLEVA